MYRQATQPYRHSGEGRNPAKQKNYREAILLQDFVLCEDFSIAWIPAFAGMTKLERVYD